MNTIAIAFDIGGTNARARIANLDDKGVPRRDRDDIVAGVTSASGLCDFISRVVHTAESGGRVDSAVVAVAGPVIDGASHLTNWPSDSAITLGELEAAGLPPGRTRLVNDVVAGAWGALAQIQAGSPDTRLRSQAQAQGDAADLKEGNLVYVAPGTGLGTAAIVRHHLGPLGASSVACETQHTRIPGFAGDIGKVSDLLSAALSRVLDWEDLISGRGLAHLYDAESALASGAVLEIGIDDAPRAGGIAAAARSGEDALAVAATDVFYRALGYYVQTLALSFLPCAAVVIGGASTETNLELLRRGGLAEAFVDHRRFADLLARTPLHTVGGEVNLEGALWLSAHV